MPLWAPLVYPYALLHGPPLLALGHFLRDDVSWVAAGIQPSIKNQTTKTKKDKNSKSKQTPKLYPQTPDQPPQRPHIINTNTNTNTSTNTNIHRGRNFEVVVMRRGLLRLAWKFDQMKRNGELYMQVPSELFFHFFNSFFITTTTTTTTTATATTTTTTTTTNTTTY